MRTVFGSTIAPKVRALFTLVLSVLMIASFQISTADYADAKKRKTWSSKKSYKKKPTRRSRPNPRYAAYVIDAKTGKVLHARNANSKRYPASLTKMMTLYLVFEDLKAGRISTSSRLVMTKAGSRRPPSKLGLKPGQSISMKQAILSLVTKSANDVATAIGDKLSGSEAAFAKRMTRKARQLGMRKTTFKNANGLTARGQITTAADMAKLGLALREHFPRRYSYFKTRNFRLGRRNYRNHNKLLGRVRGVDGIKTGYTSASGFNLVSSVSSGGRRIVAVVMGGRSGRSRNAQMTKLIRAYLPKASRGGARRLITKARTSRGKTSTLRASAIAKPSVAKKAGRKIALRINTAHIGEPPKKKDVIAVRKSIVAMNASATPKPVLRESLSIERKKTLDNRTTASIKTKPAVSKAKPGWQIQIAAADNRQKAITMLELVRSKNRRLLASTSIMTQRIVKNGTALYRARFTGFGSRKSANRACRVLKKQKYACLALDG